MSQVEVLRIPPEEPLHPVREILLRRLEQKVHVVVHQAIGMASPLEPRDGCTEEAKEPPAIVVVREDLLPSIASRRDVEDAAGRCDPRRSWHSSERMPGVKRKPHWRRSCSKPAHSCY